MGKAKERAPTRAARGESALDAALDLAGLGWSIIPLCHPEHRGFHTSAHMGQCTRPGKMPVVKWKRCQTERFGSTQLAEFWAHNPHLNLGVVTGSVSGIVMVDIDTDKGGDAWIQMAGREAQSTWEFGTGRGGRHLVYAWPHEHAPTARPFNGLEGHLDFLGEGHQSVIPPSLHVSGSRYVWLNGGPGSGMSIRVAPLCLMGAILEGAGKADRGLVGGVVEPVRPLAVGTYGQTLQRATEWAARFEPAIEKQGGLKVLFKLACSLVHGFGVDELDAYNIMLGPWNEKCQPPWEPADIFLAVKNAREKGAFDPIEQRPKSAAAGQPVKQAAKPEACPWVEGSSARTEDYEWFFKPYIPRGTPTFLVGRGGVGKSTFQGHLASLARRTLFLPGEEDVARDLKPRLEALGVDGSRWAFMKPSSNWAMPDCLKRFEEMVSRGGFDLIIADPIDSYFSDSFDENSNAAVRSFIERLREMAERLRIAVVVCRHPGKALENTMRGAGSWRNVPRVIIEMLLDEGPPARHIIRAEKYQVGAWPAARYYTLEKFKGERPRFVLGDEVEQAVADAAKDQNDRIEKLKIEDAVAFLQHVLGNGEVETVQIYNQGAEERYSDRTLRSAAERLNVQKRRQGVGKEHKCYWSLPEPVPAVTDTEGGVSGGLCQSGLPE